MAISSTGSSERRRPRRLWLIISAIAATVIIGVGLFCAYVFYNPGIGVAGGLYGAFNIEKFDRDVWLGQANSWDRDNPRGPMAENLRRKLLEERPTRADVLVLLGPDESAVMYEGKASDDRFLAYNLGMWSRFRMDYDSFDIYFDQSGRVSKVKIVQH